jgi:galactose oxidase-like protein/Kelch motif protein
LLDGKILVNGGRGPDYLDFFLGPWFQPVSSVEIYDPATNAWSPRAPMTAPRFFHTATVLGSGQVLVAGGSCAFVGFCFGALNSAEVFNPTTNAWTPTSPMVNFVQGHAATLLRYGQVLVTGRSEAFGANSVYDPATNQWTGIGRPRLDALPPLRLEHTATLLRNGRIFVVGGRERDFNGVSSTILLSLPTTELPPVVPSSQQEEFAQAFFQHTDEAGCLLTFVQVHGGTARYVDAPPTGTPNTPTPTLGLLIFQFDECSFFVRFADTVSFTTQFRTDPLLKTATLKGSASMFDLASAEAFSVTLDLTWTGYGDLIRDAGGHGSPGFGASYGQSTVRFANATGTISDGVTNFTPNPSSDDPITPDANSIKRVRTGGVFFNF